MSGALVTPTPDALSIGLSGMNFIEIQIQMPKHVFIKKKISVRDVFQMDTIL